MILNRVFNIILIFVLIISCSSATDSDKDQNNQQSQQAKFEPPDGECLFILGQADELHASLHE